MGVVVPSPVTIPSGLGKYGSMRLVKLVFVQPVPV